MAIKPLSAEHRRIINFVRDFLHDREVKPLMLHMQEPALISVSGVEARAADIAGDI